MKQQAMKIGIAIAAGAALLVTRAGIGFAAEMTADQTERRCLIWTDTWLRRNGKWQIVAAQDNRIECPSQ